jgi:peptidoglycan hydrolase CwlO-like protein
MEKGNIEIKEDVLRKLEDIKNTAESLVVKIGYLQVDLFNHPNKELEKMLDDLNKSFSEKHLLIAEACNKLEEEINKLSL